MIIIKIKQVREAKGFTVRQLSELSGISKSQITRIENNQQIPSIETLCRVAHALEVDEKGLYEYHYTENP
jgi:transcriptional regulator with XRE-family HTH domain